MKSLDNPTQLLNFLRLVPLLVAGQDQHPGNINRQQANFHQAHPCLDPARDHK